MEPPTFSTRSAMESSGSTIETSGKQDSSPKLQRSFTLAAGITEASERLRLKDIELKLIILPWSKSYRVWWSLTVIAAIITLLTEPYFIAFESPGLDPSSAGFIFEYTFICIFLVDIFLHFRLAYYDEADSVVTDVKKIAIRYLRGMFWIDLLGVLPVYAIAILIYGQPETRSALQPQSYLALLRLTRMVRGQRLRGPFARLQYDTRISLTLLTLIRNLGAIFVWSHISACIFYFIARQHHFDDSNTWIGGSLDGLNGFERYMTALYWSITTFTTVGYGDFSPVGSLEQAWGMIFMILNIIMGSWIIGSITLLIVKQDQQTGNYRDSLGTLHQYSELHGFDVAMEKSLRTQLRLEFNNREVSDEQILKHFPSSVRRKVLRRLYGPYLSKTNLMDGVRDQFVDQFLTTCKVEIFSPGEDVVHRGNMATDLYLLVGGVVMCIDDPDADEGHELEEGEFMNEISFFTDSPQTATIRTKTVCKTLSLNRAAYKLLAQDHPGSVGRILQNLLDKMEFISQELGGTTKVNLPGRLSMMRAGSTFDFGQEESDHGASEELKSAKRRFRTQQALVDVRELVIVHLNKQKDDHTTRFLFAASRNDVSTIGLMCDQGLDANSADYDARTGLMVASMKGNVDAVKKLLEFGADPNLLDVHGTSALYEAARNGHDIVMEVLLEHGAELCMSEGQSASVLCQAVFDGDVIMLRRLLKAKINPNAGDYDKRTAGHIAAAEGNTTAMRALVEFGADLNVRDRWQNSIQKEAKGSNSGGLLEYLASLKK